MVSKLEFWSFITKRTFLIISALAVILIGYGIVKSLARRHELEIEISKLKADIDTYQAKNQELNRLIQYFGTDEFKEREARLRLGLQKPGETVVVIPDLKSQDKTDASTAPEDVSNWQKWINYFFK